MIPVTVYLNEIPCVLALFCRVYDLARYVEHIHEELECSSVSYAYVAAVFEYAVRLVVVIFLIWVFLAYRVVICLLCGFAVHIT